MTAFSRGQQVLAFLGLERTTSLLVVLIPQQFCIFSRGCLSKAGVKVQKNRGGILGNVPGPAPFPSWAGGCHRVQGVLP